MRYPISGSIVGVIAAAALGCSNGQSTSPTGTGRVIFQIATSSIGSSGGPAAANVIVTKGLNVVEVSSVQLVARKIRFRRADGTCAGDPNQEDAPVAASQSSESPATDEEHECPTLKLGPLLLEPPLAEGAVTSFTADVPVGTYTGIRLQIHKPRGERDQAFLLAHPDFNGVSIRVQGTYNGTHFTFDTGIEEEEEITLATPIEVTTGGSTSFTLFLDVRSWFLDQSGSALVDPTAPSTALRSLIEHNIRMSFRAFRDENHDGHDDDH